MGGYRHNSLQQTNPFQKRPNLHKEDPRRSKSKARTYLQHLKRNAINSDLKRIRILKVVPVDLREIKIYGHAV